MEMIAHIDTPVRKNCWNTLDSYGEICVHCGCCAKDKATRYKARVATIKGWIWQKQNWYKPDDTWEEYQRDNWKESIRLMRRQLYYYQKKLREMEAH